MHSDAQSCQPPPKGPLLSERVHAAHTGPLARRPCHALHCKRFTLSLRAVQHYIQCTRNAQMEEAALYDKGGGGNKDTYFLLKKNPWEKLASHFSIFFFLPGARPLRHNGVGNGDVEKLNFIISRYVFISRQAPIWPAGRDGIEALLRHSADRVQIQPHKQGKCDI